MKMNRISIILMVVACLSASQAVRADNFNGLSYHLQYPAPEGVFSLGLDLPGWSWSFETTIPLEENLPGQYLEDALVRFCDPGSPGFDPIACGILQTILTPDAINWLNTQWNQATGILLGILPVDITTRQLPWPIDTLGTLIMHDYGFEWPCTWNPANGEYELLPFHVENTQDAGYGVSILQTYDFAGSGQIDTADGYRLEGLFDYSTGMILTAGEATVSLSIGLPADCTASPNR